MQIDMHYYGTFAMALAAGLKPEVCQTIATAAQFVDDNANTKVIDLGDGGGIDIIATAHTTTQLAQNDDRDDQRKVWVPFHFLPGCEGESLIEKLVCVKDSAVAKEMVQANLRHAKEKYGIVLIGITAHVYADTFSHYGFSGISSLKNHVQEDSITFGNSIGTDKKSSLLGKLESFGQKEWSKAKDLFHKAEGDAAQLATGYLGHAGAATFPDQPYLDWSFTYDQKQELARHDNPATFLEGCKALYALFKQFGEERQDLRVSNTSNGTDFSAIEAKVVEILSSQLDADERSTLWQQAAKQGVFTGQACDLPPYDGDMWVSEIDSMDGIVPKDLGSQDAYLFHQATEIHRTHVLRQILPKWGVHLV